MEGQILSIFGAWGVAILFVVIALKWMTKRLESKEAEITQLNKDHKKELADALTTHRTELLAREADLRQAQGDRLKDALEYTGAQRDALHLVESVLTLLQQMRDEGKDEPAWRARIETMLREIQADSEQLTLASKNLEVFIADVTRGKS